MKFKRTEIDGLAGRSGRGSQTSETSLTEISLEDDSQPTVSVGGEGETLSDELLEEPDLTASGGLKTAEISSQDTFIDQGDVGMSTEPIDFTEDEGLGDDEEIEDIGADRPRRGGARAQPRQRVVIEEARTGPLMYICLFLAAVLSLCAVLVASSVSRGYSNKATKSFAEFFNPDAYKKAGGGGGGD